MGRDGLFGSHGNKTHSGAPRPHIGVHKVPADSVPYGESISRNGRTVWAAYDGETLVAVGATVPEARRKYRRWEISRGAECEAARHEAAAK